MIPDSWNSPPMYVTPGRLALHDIPRVMEIEHACFPRSVCEPEEIYRKRIMHVPEGNLGFYFGSSLTGFLCTELWKHQDCYDLSKFSLSHDPELHHDVSGTELYISSFAVDPAFRGIIRGKAVFAMAMKHMIDHLAPACAILLVSERWHAARTIYQRWGFMETGRLASWFSPGEDGIIMRAKIR